MKKEPVLAPEVVHQVPSLCKLPPVHGEKPVVPVKGKWSEKPEKIENKKIKSDEMSKPKGEQQDLTQKVNSRGVANGFGCGQGCSMWGVFGYLFYTHLWPTLKGYVVAIYEQWVALVEAVGSF